MRAKHSLVLVRHHFSIVGGSRSKDLLPLGQHLVSISVAKPTWHMSRYEYIIHSLSEVPVKPFILGLFVSTYILCTIHSWNANFGCDEKKK